MKDTIKPGASRTATITVDKDRTIDFLGDELRVYATPELIRDIEVTCLELLQDYCDEGESSVGINVNVMHTGATPLGGQVEITATVAEVDGRRVTFDVVAKDKLDEVGRGQHGRFVVGIDQLRERVTAKKAKLASA
jgi:predicted thioesterase